MKTDKRYIIITTFQEGISFDDNFYNLLEEKIKLEEDYKIKSEIVQGKYQDITEFSLLIPVELEQIVPIKVRAKKIMTKYFQECFLDIIGSDAYFIGDKGLVINHLTWVEATRKEAIENGDFMYQSSEDKFYIVK